MKIEYKLLIKINPNDTYITLEYNEEQKVLEEKQKILTTMFPNWQEVLIVKENYNVSQGVDISSIGAILIVQLETRRELNDKNKEKFNRLYIC